MFLKGDGYRVNMAVLPALFILSRVVYYLLGIRFDAESIEWGYQLLDPYYLRTDLLRSIWYMHMQPPLYNLLIGLVLKFFPGHVAFVLHLIFTSCGFLIVWLMSDSMKMLGVTPKWKWGILCYFIFAPTAVLYEHMLFYTYFTVFFLTAAFWGLIQFTHKGKTPGLMVFYSMVSALVLTMSLFHLVFLLVLIFIPIVLFKTNRKIILRAAVFPFIFCFLWYLKNFLLFGSFSASAFLGMNMARVAYPFGTAIGDAGIFQPVKNYGTLITPDNRYPDVPVLHENYKKNGYVSFNHLGYLQVSKKFQEECIHVITHEPSRYFHEVRNAFEIYFYPSSVYEFLGPNFIKIPDLVYACSLLKDRKHALMLSLGYVMVFCSLCYLTLKAYSGKEKWFINKKSVVVIWMFVLVIAYIMCTGNFLERGENHRFRFSSTPLALMLLAWVATCFAQRKEKENH
ncbi:MAG: hypothetical protein K1X81_11360 [Bacteroidia bacterium]|nr:hypothetical protein [Bacteroidia bacterium]